MIYPSLFQVMREKADEFRNSPKDGPYWTVKHQYAALVDEVICLQNQLQKQSAEKAEAIPMKITIQYEELKSIIETHLNERMMKSPVTVTDIEVMGEKDNQGTIEALEWESIEIEVEPKTAG